MGLAYLSTGGWRLQALWVLNKGRWECGANPLHCPSTAGEKCPRPMSQGSTFWVWDYQSKILSIDSWMLSTDQPAKWHTRDGSATIIRTEFKSPLLTDWHYQDFHDVLVTTSEDWWHPWMAACGPGSMVKGSGEGTHVGISESTQGQRFIKGS